MIDISSTMWDKMADRLLPTHQEIIDNMNDKFFDNHRIQINNIIGFPGRGMMYLAARTAFN